MLLNYYKKCKLYVSYSLALSRNHCCHENETIHSHFIVVGVDVTVKNKKIIHCCHGNTTLGSLFIVAQLQCISYCS
jgi:hypothetical protein